MSQRIDEPRHHDRFKRDLMAGRAPMPVHRIFEFLSGLPMALKECGIEIDDLVAEHLRLGAERPPHPIEIAAGTLVRSFRIAKAIHCEQHALAPLGHVEHEPRPLYLPRHSIRAIIVAAFIGLAVYLYREGRLQTQTLLILGVIFAYLLGIVARAVRKWWTKGEKGPALRSFADVKALAVLSVLTYVAVAHMCDRPDLAPQAMRNVALGLVLFYFLRDRGCGRSSDDSTRRALAPRAGIGRGARGPWRQESGRTLIATSRFSL